MNRTPPRVSSMPLLLLMLVVIGIAVIAALMLSGGPASLPAPAVPTAPQKAPAQLPPKEPAQASQREPTVSSALVMKDQRIYALNGNLAYRGDVDLRPTLDRIERGIRDPHDNDGSVFGNFERRLPQKNDRQYYREYVIRTPNLREVGPQRLIIGKGDEVYYTPDHYESFVRVR